MDFQIKALNNKRVYTKFTTVIFIHSNTAIV